MPGDWYQDELDDLRAEFPRARKFRCREGCIGGGAGGHHPMCPDAPDYSHAYDDDCECDECEERR